MAYGDESKLRSSKKLNGRLRRLRIAAAATRAAVLPIKALLICRSTCCQDLEFDEHGGKDKLNEELRDYTIQLEVKHLLQNQPTTFATLFSFCPSCTLHSFGQQHKTGFLGAMWNQIWGVAVVLGSTDTNFSRRPYGLRKHSCLTACECDTFTKSCNASTLSSRGPPEMTECQNLVARDTNLAAKVCLKGIPMVGER
jgi:hypothetical protein